MLHQLRQRQASLNLSTRQLAIHLGVAPSLVSMVLTERRAPTEAFNEKVRDWLVLSELRSRAE